MKALIALVVVVAVLALALFAFTFSRWEGQAPRASFDRNFEALGRTPILGLNVEDSETGLRHVAIRLKQNEQEVVLAEESFERGAAEKTKRYEIGTLIDGRYKIQDGPATLTVRVTDHALRNFLGGNTSEITKDFVFDSQPPRLQVFEGQHYINQGGSECVVYRVSEDTEISGIQVGPHFFPGYPAGGDKDVRLALFAFKYDMPANTPIKVIARDAAGNESTADFWQRVFPKAFRHREIAIDDAFIQKVVPEILANTREIQDQGDPVKNFVEINSNLRRQNHESIVQLSKESVDQFLWNGPFLQLSNSKVESFFADRRTYMYQGKAIDQQDHVGFDLSVVMQYPIEAANDGKVVLADYFGIYGNTVLIDHGTGLISLYGHLSSIDVKPGQMVKKKEILGRSGATGLAAGDHLHFGLFLHGIPVNATEWWDPKWVQEHVLDRLKSQ